MDSFAESSSGVGTIPRRKSDTVRRVGSARPASATPGEKQEGLMSLSSAATAPGRRSTRVAPAVTAAVALLVPLAVLFVQVWSSTGDARSFTVDERRGAA